MNTKKINIGIVAHVDAGKTTITEQFLYKSGAIRNIGRVDKGNTVTDNLGVEKAHGITVRTSTVSFKWQDVQVNLLDTPGHMDFIAEVERSLSVLDGAILTLSAKEGVQIQTRIIFEALTRLRIPTVIFINKVDRMGVDLNAVYTSIEQMLTPEIVRLNQVSCTGHKDFIITDSWHDPNERIKLIESGALLDDLLLENYTQEVEVSYEEVEKVLIQAFMDCKIHPVLHGSALHGLGIDALLDMITNWLTPKQTESLFGRVYKIDRDSQGRRRCYVRLYGGQLNVRGVYRIVGDESLLKVAQLAAIEAGKTHLVETLNAGDVGIIYNNRLKIEDRIVEDFGDEKCINGDTGLETYSDHMATIASPMLKAAVHYEDLAQRKELIEALIQLTDEDPFLDFGINPITEEVEVKLFGNIQRTILESILMERFELKTQIDETVTIYKEKPLSKAEHVIYIYHEGNHDAATVGLKIELLSINSGFKYKSTVSLGNLKKPFQNAVEEGVRSALTSGLKGWELTDLSVEFFYSEFNSVDSTPADFRRLAPEVFKVALEKSGTVLLEPLLKFDIKVPESCVGKVISDVTKMRGDVQKTKCIQDEYHLEGIVPVDTSKDYLMTLLNDTSGQGVFATTYYGYREV